MTIWSMRAAASRAYIASALASARAWGSRHNRPCLRDAEASDDERRVGKGCIPSRVRAADVKIAECCRLIDEQRARHVDCERDARVRSEALRARNDGRVG